MRRTILLADDSSTIQRLVTQIFADADFDIVCVSNGEAAIRKLDEVHPDVVLADIYMPGRNGYEVCAYIRKQSKMPKIPVILLVGALESFDEQTARQAEATANITKPFEPGALVELVSKVLDKAEEEGKVLALTSDLPASSDPAAGLLASPDSADLLGLEMLFKEETQETQAPIPVGVPTMSSTLAEADIDRIADRAIEKLSAQLVERIARDVVPGIVEKTLREELKKGAAGRP
jgi:CheY-like chemotaxis protein